MINFISNLPQGARSGGFSAMSAAAWEALGKRHVIHYAGPVDPPVELWRKGLSKLVRAVGGAGNYAFFSVARLMAIEAEVRGRCREDAELDFYHGFTPWIATSPQRPYIAWSDCTFRDYIEIYHRRADFRAADLRRIEQAEAAWMRGALWLGFTSAWAANRAMLDYNLDSSRVSVVGIFGETEMPEVDTYDGSRRFAFISTNFAAKGGPVVLAAFRRLLEHHPDARLVVVGDAPKGLEDEPNVTVAGFLRKEDPAQNARFRDILGGSRAVVHPTRSDIAPLLAVEAGYFGCPVISSRRYAIPEIVEDGRTGLLLNDPEDEATVAAAMAWMLEAPTDYLAMRRAAWARSRAAHTREQFEGRLLAGVATALGQAGGVAA